MHAGILATVLPVIRQMVQLLQEDPDHEAVSKAGTAPSSGDPALLT